MAKPDPELEKTTALQLIRQAIRSRNLRRLKEGLERPWPLRVMRENTVDAKPSAMYIIFEAALVQMAKEERQRAFQWTWDCYHPYMADLAKCLEDIDGYTQGRML